MANNEPVHTKKGTSLPDFFQYCVQNQLPLAIYRLPKTSSIHIIAQNQSSLLNTIGAEKLTSKTGFLFCPFQPGRQERNVLIAADILTSSKNLPPLEFAICKTSKPLFKGNNSTYTISKDEYLKYVKEIQTAIGLGKFKKVVAARVVKRKREKSFDAIKFFNRLCKKYPSAFISLVYTAQYGLWIGATPEVLLNIDADGVSTYSLAGTKSVDSSLPWGDKEKQEQKIVSDYILSAFECVTKNKPFIKGPKTIRAGNLQHLRSTFTYKGLDSSKLSTLLAALHPTPAVAGWPKLQSVKFIQAHEEGGRGFYSGYLGPLNIGGQTNLFVNLRCMQVLENSLAIYVGCGITIDSQPAAEWKESEMKAETLLSVLRDLTQ